MRDRFYIYIGVFILTIITCIMMIFSYNYKIKYYHTINMIYIGEKKYDLLIDDYEYRLITHNSSIYIDDKRYDYEIIKYNKSILYRNNKPYHELIIYINKKNYKKNDIVIGSIISKKVRIIEVFIGLFFEK